MSVFFDLACGDCKEFIDLGNWSVVEDAGNSLVRACLGPSPGESPYPIRADSYMKVLISADDIEAALRGKACDESYIGELIPIVGAFAREHRGHELFLTIKDWSPRIRTSNPCSRSPVAPPRAFP
jgi:hypothetical protein